MKDILFTDIYKYALVWLYKAKKQGKHSFTSFRDILKEIEQELSPDEIFSISKFMENMGYVESSYTFGNSYLYILYSGLAHVELELLKEDKFKDFFDNLNLKSDAPYNKNKEAQDVDKHIIIKKLKALGLESKEDEIKKSIDILALEIKSENPDPQIMRLKLENLERFLSNNKDFREIKQAIEMSF